MGYRVYTQYSKSVGKLGIVYSGRNAHNILSEVD